MKAAPLLVAWHDNNDPVYSAHFEPHGKGRLATAGGDANVRVSQKIRELLVGGQDTVWLTRHSVGHSSFGASRPWETNARLHISRRCGNITRR